MHKTVFLDRAVLELNLTGGDVVVDATFGTGGHSQRILEKIRHEGMLVAIDSDPQAVERAEELQKKGANIFPVHTNFRYLDCALKQAGYKQMDAILFDLGFSQDQLELSGRGFSFRREEPLDMRMDPRETQSAHDIVNNYSESEIRAIIEKFGEDYRALKIARAIVACRQKAPIETTMQLAGIVMQIARPRERFGRTHPATRTFQALRIAVNDELGALQEALEKVALLLAPGGRCVVISFHSLEDRIVKHFFRKQAKECVLEVITPKPVAPSAEEVQENPRARSAKLRVAEKRGQDSQTVLLSGEVKQ